VAAVLEHMAAPPPTTGKLMATLQAAVVTVTVQHLGLAVPMATLVARRQELILGLAAAVLERREPPLLAPQVRRPRSVALGVLDWPGD
jgi:hypothetical protein